MGFHEDVFVRTGNHPHGHAALGQRAPSQVPRERNEMRVPSSAEQNRAARIRLLLVVGENAL